jgi:hypothetical protein
MKSVLRAAALLLLVTSAFADHTMHVRPAPSVPIPPPNRPWNPYPPYSRNTPLYPPKDLKDVPNTPGKPGAEAYLPDNRSNPRRTRNKG